MNSIHEPLTEAPGTSINAHFLTGERLLQIFHNFEKIGDMYQNTEAFCHYS